jgi:ankyrin repeat protein
LALDPLLQALNPSLRALNPSLQALVDKYSYLWRFSGVETVEVNQTYDADGDALLHHVALTSGVDEVDLLVACGAEVNARGDMGFTPLHYAAMRGRLKVVEKLLALGADAGLRNEWGDTASTTAKNCGHSEVVRLLSRAKKNHW